MTKYRLTIPALHPPGSPGHTDPLARQGYYVEAPTSAEAVRMLRERLGSNHIFEVELPPMPPSTIDPIYAAYRKHNRDLAAYLVGHGYINAGVSMLGGGLLGVELPWCIGDREVTILVTDHEDTGWMIGVYASHDCWDHYEIIGEDLQSLDSVAHVIDAFIERGARDAGYADHAHAVRETGEADLVGEVVR